MVEIKINGDPYQFPTVASEINLRQFFALRKAKNVLEEICAVTGMDKETVENFKNPKTVQAALTLMNTLAADIKNGFDGVTLPDFVYIGLKKVKVPKDLHLEPIGAFMSVNDILAQKENENKAAGRESDYTDEIPRVLAHYFFTHVFPGEMYSDEKAEAPGYMELIYNLPLVQAVPIGNFFFLRFPNLQ